MKLFVSVCVFAFGLIATAKTIEQNHNCFHLDSGTPNAQIPQKICFQIVKVLPAANDVVVTSYLQPELFMDTKLDNLTRKNEDGFTFKLSNIILNQWDGGCSEGRRQEIIISGRANNEGLGEDWSYEVTLEETTAKDTCHSPEQWMTYNYK